MTLDVRGSIKSTRLSHNRHAIFEELISNAIDAYLIRLDSDSALSGLRIMIDVCFRRDLLGGNETMTITCKDNGCGLGKDQLQAFLTKDTSYKDDLPISGIGKCKGSGRIQFFHQFSELSIDSTFLRDGEPINASLRFVEPRKLIRLEDFVFSPGIATNVGSSFVLDKLKDGVRSILTRDLGLSEAFAASTLRSEMLVAFMQRLVSLKTQLGNFEIIFSTYCVGEKPQVETLGPGDLPNITTTLTATVEERDPSSGEGLGTVQSIKLSHYRLDAAFYKLPRNAIALCANLSPVKDITSRYLRTRSEQNNPVAGFHHIVLVEGDCLDRCVNEQRDSFDKLPDEIPSGDFLSTETIALSDIFNKIDPLIDKLVSPAEWRKDAVLSEATEKFGMSEQMLQETSTRIVYGDTPLSVAERVLKKYQERVMAATAEIVDLKEEIVCSEPDSEEYRRKINELSWKYTSSLKDFDMAHLSQLVVRRAAVVEILELACGKKLNIQSGSQSVRRKDERIIHSIFFPMRKDSAEARDQHDIWLLSEEYQYFDYIASDVPLANIAWSNSEPLFAGDIDEDLASLLASRAHQNGGKRPDIAIFSKEGSAIIIEFKAPGVFMDEHIGDLVEYSHLLAAKSGGKLRKFYGYLIGDTVNPLRLNNWSPFPTNGGWFQSSSLLDPGTRAPLGETYFEILHYEDIVDRARKRIGVYKKKLSLSF